MDSDETTGFARVIRPSHDTAIEESGLFGTRRGWVNINRYEIIFLIVGILATIVTDSLTIIRLAGINNNNIKDPDTAYGILILVHSIFLLLFLITGIFYQRITDIVAFFISAVLLTVYVIAHFVARRNTPGANVGKDPTIRLIRLIFTIVFNICFLPLAILVIQDYRRDEFSKRLFGAFPAARRPLQMYNIFDCVARINTMLSISTLLLNLYNFNSYESIDKIFLGIGIPLVFIWLGIGIGMVRLENRILVGIFYLISLFQPAFLGYCLYSAIKNSSIPDVTVAPITTTSSVSTITSSILTITSSISTTALSTSTATPLPSLVPVLQVLYVCISTNILAHLLSMIFGFICVRNFGKGLEERVFNNQLDKWFQKRWSKT